MKKTILLKNNSTDHPNFPGEVRILRQHLDDWTAQMKWYVDENVNDNVAEVLQNQTAVFQHASELTIPSPYGTWIINNPDVPAPGANK